MKKLVWLSFMVVLAILSYVREILFLSINSVITGQNYFYAKTTKIEFFLDKSIETLTLYKYIMTVSFTVLFAFFTILGLKLSFKNKLPFHIGIVVYCLCTIIAFLLILYSMATDSFSSIYTLLRLIIEYLHNPILYIILSASYLGYQFSKKQSIY